MSKREQKMPAKGLAKELVEERQFLEKEIDDIERRLDKYPSGSLQISHSHGHIQFYYREEQADSKKFGRSTVHYMKKKDTTLAVQLAQRDYERQLLRQLKKRYDVINKAASAYAGFDINSLYDKLTNARKELVIPRYTSDDDYAAQWQNVEFTGKAFTEGVPEIYTARGERVRSKSEKIIADTFDRYDIPYRYEYPVEFKGKGTLYPDFTVLNRWTKQEYYWEHLGMMDQPDYAAEAVKRIEFFGMHGIFIGKNLLITAETKSRPLNLNILDQMIQEFLVCK